MRSHTLKADCIAGIAALRTATVSARSKGVGSCAGGNRGSSVSGGSIFFGFVLGFGFWALILSWATAAWTTAGCFSGALVFALGMVVSQRASAPPDESRGALAWAVSSSALHR